LLAPGDCPWPVRLILLVWLKIILAVHSQE
jgi:hypothetical protein